jgi:hypothetical protein
VESHCSFELDLWTGILQVRPSDLFTADLRMKRELGLQYSGSPRIQLNTPQLQIYLAAHFQNRSPSRVTINNLDPNFQKTAALFLSDPLI